jgi:hypothetical protein
MIDFAGIVRVILVQMRKAGIGRICVTEPHPAATFIFAFAGSG